jgi:DNA-binding response OmpR family regulator
MVKSILMLDLSSALSSELAHSLEARGWKVMRCQSVLSLDHALKGIWDLVLTEWDFYQFHGSQLIQLLRPERQPVLVCSRQETSSIAAEALEAGARGVFSSFSRSALLDEIQRQLDGTHGLFEDGVNLAV